MLEMECENCGCVYDLIYMACPMCAYPAPDEPCYRDADYIEPEDGLMAECMAVGYIEGLNRARRKVGLKEIYV